MGCWVGEICTQFCFVVSVNRIFYLLWCSPWDRRSTTIKAVLRSSHSDCGLWVVCMINFYFSAEIMGTLHSKLTTRNILPSWHMKWAWLLLQQYFIDFAMCRSVLGATGLILPYLEEEVFPQLYIHDLTSWNHFAGLIACSFQSSFTALWLC